MALGAWRLASSPSRYVPSKAMKLLVATVLAATLSLTACGAVDSALDVGQQAIDAGKGAVDAGKQAVEAGQEAIETGRDVIDTAQDTVQAADDLLVACDIVREAVQPGVEPERSADLFAEAMAIVGGVVAAYPNVPGIAELEAGLAAARAALSADPTGASLGITQGAVESACSRIPSFG